MNVPAAMELAVALADVCNLDPAQLGDGPGKQQLWGAECLLGELGRCLCSIFDREATLAAQLTDLSKLAHMLAYLYSGTGNRTKFIPAQLYHDMQAMVKNAYFCVAKASCAFVRGSVLSD